LGEELKRVIYPIGARVFFEILSKRMVSIIVKVKRARTRKKRVWCEAYQLKWENLKY
jgi:hypothetical protein